MLSSQSMRHFFSAQEAGCARRVSFRYLCKTLDHEKEKKNMKTFEYESYGMNVKLAPGLGLYRARDFMGKEHPGIAITLDDVNAQESFAAATVNLRFIGVKDCFYLDENNLPGIGKALSKAGIAFDTGLRRHSGFAEYPLYQFRDEVIEELEKSKTLSGENYRTYSKAFEKYFKEFNGI